ncbi:hypothetical protein COCVIDRAFT_32903 [Bipolaris victoriae FI3]|uniref:F-box domain-containing protein n=1 Tax=Bipolaris victoriae (strain FI3) TaxID=930091 RepID=W7FAT5_BIPV3|nr:hypothetical protein COCVIDRAFT_32903 [Bipolaris victoriae FI3]
MRVVLAHPPWTKALKRNRLFRLSTLPAELQFHVLTFCSASTLFQLMRVSSSLRKEAQKLFWAYSDTYFVIKARWLLDGGYAGYTSNDLDFLAKVQNIQIDCDLGTRHQICLIRNGAKEVQQDRIRHFWDVFQRRCPRAKRVIINQIEVSISTGKGVNCLEKALQHLVQSSPPGILASASSVQEADVPADIGASDPSTQNLQIAVYQRCPDSSWKKNNLGKHWKAVLVPAKRFSGPVGRIYEIRYRDSLEDMKYWGFWITVVEAVDRYHFDKGRNWPFSCPLKECDVYFQEAGEWTRHALEFHPQGLLAEYCIISFPRGRIQDELVDYRNELSENHTKSEEETRKIQQQWNRAGQEQRNEMKRMWQQQLRNDPAWETGVEDWSKNRIWQEINQMLQEGEAKLSIKS